MLATPTEEQRRIATSLKPLARMWERVEMAREDSDTSFFLDLLYTGEMVAKLVTLGMVSADERQSQMPLTSIRTAAFEARTSSAGLKISDPRRKSSGSL